MTSVDAGRILEQLSSHRPLPRSRIAPALSYGRHRGPAPVGSRIAAVAVTLYQDADGQWIIPLTLRPTSLQHHGGQVCLPGGRVEQDEDIFTAAMREFHEELGVEPRVSQRCGELSSLYVYASNNLVHPVVAVIDRPMEGWNPDPVEVEEVIEMPLSVLLSEDSRTELVRKRTVCRQQQQVGQMRFRASAFAHQGQLIWGATALILDQLVRILRP